MAESARDTKYEVTEELIARGAGVNVKWFVKSHKFSATALDIGRKIRSFPGLEGLLNCRITEICMEDVVEFWDNIEKGVTEHSIATQVGENQILLTDEQLRRILGFGPAEEEASYNQNHDDKAKLKFVKEIQIDQTVQTTMSINCNYIQAEYASLSKIIARCLLGIIGSLDTLSGTKVNYMMIIHNKEKFDWAKWFIHRILILRKGKVTKLPFAFAIQKILDNLKISKGKRVKVNQTKFKPEVRQSIVGLDVDAILYKSSPQSSERRRAVEKDAEVTKPTAAVNAAKKKKPSAHTAKKNLAETKQSAKRKLEVEKVVQEDGDSDHSPLASLIKKRKKDEKEATTAAQTPAAVVQESTLQELKKTKEEVQQLKEQVKKSDDKMDIMMRMLEEMKAKLDSKSTDSTNQMLTSVEYNIAQLPKMFDRLDENVMADISFLKADLSAVHETSELTLQLLESFVFDVNKGGELNTPGGRGRGRAAVRALANNKFQDQLDTYKQPQMGMAPLTDDLYKVFYKQRHTRPYKGHTFFDALKLFLSTKFWEAKTKAFKAKRKAQGHKMLEKDITFNVNMALDEFKECYQNEVFITTEGIRLSLAEAWRTWVGLHPWIDFTVIENPWLKEFQQELAELKLTSLCEM